MTTRARTAAAATAAAAVTLSLASLAGCQYLAQYAPQPTPNPTTASSSSSSPAETSRERTIRLDKVAAVKAYKAVDAEHLRLALAGGASKPTKVLTDNAGGVYLQVQMKGLRLFKSKGYRVDSAPTSTVTADGGWSAKELGLTACEDASKVRLLDKSGKEIRKDRPKRFVQTLTATKVDGRWKITDVDSKIVKTFRNEGGCQGL